MEKVKRPAVTHNATKIKALLFLKMRKQAGYKTTTAREIATAINGNVRSLYVLLERWLRWDLVIRFEGSPFSYCIDSEGERYLSKIDNWFFSGYYSRKRKRRVLGFRGKAADLMRDIAVAAQAVVYAYDIKRNELFSFEAPFKKAENFKREPIIDNKQKRWGKDHLILKRFESISEAYNTLKEWGFESMKPMGQAMVDAGIGVVWSPDEA